MFKQWFHAVEQAAVTQASEIFPWDIACFADARAQLPAKSEASSLQDASKNQPG